MNPQQEEAGIKLENDVVASSPRSANYDTLGVKGNRILIVDDEPDIVTVYKKILTADGFSVKGFSDSEKALLEFKPGVYDLVILDVRMPKMNGFELCKEIRTIDEKVKIFFMTAFEIHLSEFERVLPSIRIDGFIKKPLRLADLRSIVHNAVNNGHGASKDK
jgi:DNA-binding response OmpR family regulator